MDFLKYLFFHFIEDILQNPAEGVLSHHKNGCSVQNGWNGTTWGSRKPFRQRVPPAWGSEFRWGTRRRHNCPPCCFPAPHRRPSSSGPDIRGTCSRGRDLLDRSSECDWLHNCYCCWFVPRLRSKTEATYWKLSTASRPHPPLSLNRPRKVGAETVASDGSDELPSLRRRLTPTRCWKEIASCSPESSAVRHFP